MKSIKSFLRGRWVLLLLPLLVLGTSLVLNDVRQFINFTPAPVPSPVPTITSPLPKQAPKKTSGICGWSTQAGGSAEAGNFTASSYTLVIKGAKGKRIIKKVKTKDNGDFNVTLPPGNYIIIPNPELKRGDDAYITVNNAEGFSGKAKVTVWKGYYTPITVFFRFRG